MPAMFPFNQLDRLEHLSLLDPLASRLSSAVRAAVRPPAVADALHGTFQGHPLHPALVPLPLGTFLSAALLDAVGGRQAERSADLLAAAGLLTTVPTAVAGLTDWSAANPSEQRSGLVHALANVAATGCWAASLAARVSGDRRRGRLLGLAGVAGLVIGGSIGGHLSYRRSLGANANATIGDTGPTDWTDAGDGDLPEGRPVLRQAAGTPVLLVRTGARIEALLDRCGHQSGPLHEGQLADGCVTCPWHGSTFRLSDGAVVHGPATFPQPALAVRLSGDRLQVKLR